MSRPHGLNIMDLVELIIVPILGFYLVYRNFFDEKLNPVELIIILYLGWEFFKKLNKFFKNKNTPLS